MFLNKKSTVYSARNVCYKSNHEEILISKRNILQYKWLVFFRNIKNTKD